jgi:hypothetical protein
LTIPEFASQHRLKLSHDGCDDPIIQGRIGKDSDVSDYGGRELAMCFLPGSKRTGLWNRIKVTCLTAGMRLHQEGDGEGIFVFNPADPVQAKLAIKSVQARARRKMTPETLARLAKVGFKGQKHTQEGLVLS